LCKRSAATKKSDTIEAKNVNSKIINLVKIRGPILPIHASKETGQTLLLTGAFLSRAALEFGSGSQVGLAQPVVRVDFNPEGTALFSELTKNNIGRFIAIFLDGTLISAPVVQDHISNGTAIISGNFTAESARELVRNLNLGALPVPIELASIDGPF